jgi:hypothetical protein
LKNFTKIWQFIISYKTNLMMQKKFIIRFMNRIEIKKILQDYCKYYY